ncbi:hypothetical protein As57867_005637, partial [Aphanomyces stellatus]
ALSQKTTRLETEVDELTTQVRVVEASNQDLKDQLESALEDKVFLQTDYDDMEKTHELSSERLRSEILELKSELFAVQSKISTACPRPISSSAEQNEAEVARESFLSSLIDENPFRPSLSLEIDMEENDKHI